MARHRTRTQCNGPRTQCNGTRVRKGHRLSESKFDRTAINRLAGLREVADPSSRVAEEEPASRLGRSG